MKRNGTEKPADEAKLNLVLTAGDILRPVRYKLAYDDDGRFYKVTPRKITPLTGHGPCRGEVFFFKAVSDALTAATS